MPVIIVGSTQEAGTFLLAHAHKLVAKIRHLNEAPLEGNESMEQRVALVAQAGTELADTWVSFQELLQYCREEDARAGRAPRSAAVAMSQPNDGSVN